MQRRLVHRCALRSLLVAGLGLAAITAFAQNFPTRPVTLICPYGAGSGIDLTARILGEKLAEYWGQPVVVRNQPGAAGNIGADAAAKAAPDGHTIIIIANSHLTNQHVSKNVRDATRDFEPVAPAGTLPYLLTVSNTLPVKSIRELVALAKSRPGAINYGGVVGSLPHLLGVMLKSAGEIDITFVSYKSTLDPVADVMSGRVPIWITPVAPALPYLKAGSVRALGVTGDKRTPLLPDVPTMAEAGFPELNTGSSQYYILAPLNTPRPIVAKLNADISRAITAKDVKEKLAALGLDADTSTPDELGRVLRAELARWGKVVKAAGMHTE